MILKSVFNDNLINNYEVLYNVHSIHLSSSAYFQSHFKRINGIEIYVESWNRGASSFLVPNLIRNFRKHFGSGVLKFGPAP